MRLSKHKTPGTLSFNITPMIDIVFLLIIFFMTVSQITRNMDTPLPLPRVERGDVKSEAATLTINMGENGNLIVAGKPCTLPEVVKAARRRFQRVNNDPSRIRVQLRVHRSCPSRHVTQLLTRLSELGLTNVRSAVEN